MGKIIKAINDAIGIEISRENNVLSIKGIFETNVTAVRKIPIEAFQKFLEGKENYIIYREGKQKLLIWIVPALPQLTVSSKMVEVFFEPPMHHCDLIVVEEKEFREEIRNLIKN
jgi:hypothetical protein